MTTSPAISGETFAEGFRRRLALNGFALVYVLLAVPAVVLLSVMTASLSVAVVGVGMVLLLVFVPILEQMTNIHRRLSGRILGVEIERPYAKVGLGSPWKVLRAWAVDSARWRDFAWTWMSVTIGWALSWIAFGTGLAVIWYAIFPFLYRVTPDGAFDMNYGIINLDTQAESFLEWIWLAVAFLVWWKLLPVLMKWRAELDRSLLSPSRDALERRVAEVSASRTETIDHSAAELRRIERDLHDGAQARLVALGMNLGLAQELLATDPEAATALLAEARGVTTSALGDLRSVVRGIHPPVLADRGLAGAVQALALDMPFPTSVMISLTGRPPAPIESAAYFATSELLANIGKHAGASRAVVEVTHENGVLHLRVEDDGSGGADPANGSGLAGVARRLAAFDGTMTVSSPADGPTVISLSVPCELSSRPADPH